MSAALTPSFNQKYVSTNIKPGAPPYAPDIVQRYIEELQAQLSESQKLLCYPILTTLFIGARRGDFVPRLFEEYIVMKLDSDTVKSVFYLMRESIMASYAFVGVPWVVPACLGIVDVLQRRSLEDIAKENFRSDPLDVDSLLITGKEVVSNTYRGVNNDEVRDMLSIAFPEMRKGISLVVWGYNVGGAVKAGLHPRETELFIATAIISSGATRQARSHIKASLGMGNEIGVVAKIVELANEFTDWNGAPIEAVDVEALAAEIRL
ncbi:hypothetical protein BJY01DRAFT_255909 [Aspergillus pseudoustus]|uniref:AhpD-like protein n=1 Tax=Aspergillus pseudoustus TaxID=1810923 RepID=A0ABR4IG68_9EURO